MTERNRPDRSAASRANALVLVGAATPGRLYPLGQFCLDAFVGGRTWFGDLRFGQVGHDDALGVDMGSGF